MVAGVPPRRPAQSGRTVEHEARRRPIPHARPGRRLDYVHSSDYPYHDPRGARGTFAGLAARHGIALRQLWPTELEVIKIRDGAEFGFKVPFDLVGGPVRCEVFKVQGEALGEAQIRRTNELDWVMGLEGGVRYVVTVHIGRGRLPDPTSDGITH